METDRGYEVIWRGKKIKVCMECYESKKYKGII